MAAFIGGNRSCAPLYGPFFVLVENYERPNYIDKLWWLFRQTLLFARQGTVVKIKDKTGNEDYFSLTPDSSWLYRLSRFLVSSSSCCSCSLMHGPFFKPPVGSVVLG